LQSGRAVCWVAQPASSAVITSHLLMVQDYLDRQGSTRSYGASQEPDDYCAGQAAPEFAQACIRAPNEA